MPLVSAEPQNGAPESENGAVFLISSPFWYSRRLSRGHGNLFNDDTAKALLTAINDDNLALPPSFAAPRRQSAEGESARNHALYKNVLPHPDGLFHCPWEGKPECNHRPEKLKCNYE